MSEVTVAARVLSVLVLGVEGDLGASLVSLAVQDVEQPLEVVVVLAPGDRAGAAAVAHTRSAYPSLRIRVLEVSGVRRQREAGARAATGEQLTVVGRGDVVRPDFLRRLLQRARPGQLSVAPIAGAADDPESDLFVPNGTQPLAGKLLPTAVAAALPEACDASLWLPFLARTRASYAVAPTDTAYVAARPTPWEQPVEGEYDDVVTPLLDDVVAVRAGAAGAGSLATLVAATELIRATRINEHLRRRPDDHARLVADVRARGITRFRWDRVNEGLARDLAICYAFPPYQDTSGLVAARRLRERGTVVDVISAEIDRLRSKDPATVLVPAEVVDRSVVLGGRSSFGLWQVVARFARLAEAEVTRLEREKGAAYRTLYSRAMAVNSHVAAALVKLRRPDLPWTAELSDPLKVHPHGEERVSEVGEDELYAELCAGIRAAGYDVPPDVKLFEFVEILTYALADRIIFTNDHQRSFMLGYTRDPGLVERAMSVSEVAAHPTLPPDFYRLRHPRLELEPDVVHIAYFGVFYKTRGLDEVTGALERLAPDVRHRLRLHIFTNRDDHLAIEKFASELADVVRVRPFVPFLDFLNLTTRFDVLLVNDADATRFLGINPYLPSKLSDYRGSGRPVWAMTEPGSVLDGLDTAYASRLGDEDDAIRVLSSIVADLGPQEELR